MSCCKCCRCECHVSEADLEQAAREIAEKVAATKKKREAIVSDVARILSDGPTETLARRNFVTSALAQFNCSSISQVPDSKLGDFHRALLRLQKQHAYDAYRLISRKLAELWVKR